MAGAAAKGFVVAEDRGPPPFLAAAKDAGFAALVTLALLGLLVGFETRQTLTNAIELNPRFGVLGACVAVVFAGRLATTWALRAPGLLVARDAFLLACGLVVLGFLLNVVGGHTGAAAVGGGASQVVAIQVVAIQAVAIHAAAFLRDAGYALLWWCAPAVLAAGALLAAKRAIWPDAPKAAPKADGLVARMEANAGPVFLALALAFPMLVILGTGGLQASRFWVDVGILLLTYVMLGWGLNVVVGLAGLLDLGYVAFYAVGAYSYALIATTLVQVPGFQGLGPWMFFICLPVAGILAAFWGILLGFPVLRLRGDYLAIVTLAFGEIIRLVLINWTPVTGGGAGISSIPRPTFFGIPFTGADEGFAARFGIEFDPMHRVLYLYYVILVLAAVTYVVTLRLRRLPVGRAWEALREDEIACRSLGINTVNTKLTAFAIGAMFGGFAGCFFAARQGFISPESFTFMESAIILAIVVLGGMGSMLGVIIATIVLIGGPELLRSVDFLKAVLGDDFDPAKFRMILLGLGMVAIMIWRPRGLISTREPTAFLFKRKLVSGEHAKEGHG